MGKEESRMSYADGRDGLSPDRLSPDRLSLDGLVAAVTGAGGGLGRAEALALAAGGARVVVNDVRVPGREDRAAAVADEIRADGGEAVAVAGDVGDWSTGDALVGTALAAYGSFDVLVNNAGILRERMLFNMAEEEWDELLRVHLKGHFVTARAATAHWRRLSKERGAPVYARMVNTASEAYLSGSPGQANYAAAKGGIVSLTMAVARGCDRYGVRANAICPRARTAMTEAQFEAPPAGGVDPMSTDHVAPFVAWLASPAAGHVNAQVFIVYGGKVALLKPPSVDRVFEAPGERWSLEDLDRLVGTELAGRDPGTGYAVRSLLEDAPAG
jgi:NAD(P)-dependent dehydrogenase (short-subunit alcohol dehydrogenase family)